LHADGSVETWNFLMCGDNFFLVQGILGISKTGVYPRKLDPLQNVTSVADQNGSLRTFREMANKR
jgi:hypothetical protein